MIVFLFLVVVVVYEFIVEDDGCDGCRGTNATEA